MKIILSLFLCASLALCVVAQDRSLPSRRAFQPAPVLLTMTGTQDAAGIAQTPMGYVVPLYGFIPEQSRVSLYGRSLMNTSAVLLWHDGGIVAIPAQSARNSFPGLETVAFRLPAGVVGEVWVTTIGRQSSNTVRLVVE